MSGADTEINGIISEDISTAAEVSIATASTYVGVPSAQFSFVYNGGIITFAASAPFIADLGLYAAMNAASAPVSWSS